MLKIKISILFIIFTQVFMSIEKSRIDEQHSIMQNTFNKSVENIITNIEPEFPLNEYVISHPLFQNNWAHGNVPELKYAFTLQQNDKPLCQVIIEINAFEDHIVEEILQNSEKLQNVKNQLEKCEQIRIQQEEESEEVVLDFKAFKNKVGNEENQLQNSDQGCSEQLKQEIQSKIGKLIADNIILNVQIFQENILTCEKQENEKFEQYNVLLSFNQELCTLEFLNVEEGLKISRPEKELNDEDVQDCGNRLATQYLTNSL